MPDICHSDVAYKGSILCNVPAVSDLHYAEFLTVRMLGMSYLVCRCIIATCKRYFLYGEKGTFGQPFLQRRSLHNIKSQLCGCGQKTHREKTKSHNEIQRTCGLHVSSISSLLLCGFAYRAAHERCVSPDKKNDSLDALSCCQGNSEQKSNAQLLFSGRGAGMQRMSGV